MSISLKISPQKQKNCKIGTDEVKENKKDRNLKSKGKLN